MDILALGEENFAKNLVENDKKLRMVLVRIRERKRSLKKFWKSDLNKSNLTLKKTYPRFSIDQESVSIDRNRQKLTKILNVISIDWKIDWINWNFGKTKFLTKITWFFEKTPQSIEYNE